MIVNLNVKCKVILNDLGKQAWLSQFHSLPDELKEDHPEILDLLTSAIGKDNGVEATLWEIMALFGPYISMTNSPFESTTIELHRNLNLMDKGGVPIE